MKTVLARFVAALALASLAGAALSQPRPNPAWPKTLTLGTASVSSTYFVYG